MDNITFASLLFLAEEDTFGYYWCEVTFPSMNKASSSFVAVISNSSLPLCSDIAVPYDPPSNTNIDCAVEGFSASEIATSLPPTTLYSTSTNEYLSSPSTTVSEVPNTAPSMSSSLLALDNIHEIQFYKPQPTTS